jgi:[acyl-carrier-protein] S-malonyltransferase
VTRFAELGVGKALTGMVKRSAPNAQAISVSTPIELETFAQDL